MTTFQTPSGKANGLTLDAQGDLIRCEHQGRRVSRVARDGAVTTLADRYQGKRLNSPNDAVVKSDGSIYFTDPPAGLGGGDAGPGPRGIAEAGRRRSYRSRACIVSTPTAG